MFITNKRVEEIDQLIKEKGLFTAQQEVDSEEFQAFLDVTLGIEPRDERDRAICAAYKAGILTEEDDPTFLW